MIDTVGHNKISDQELLERNLRTGMRSAGFDVLVRAAADKRLDRKALLILAGIIWAMQHTGYATPGRATLAAFAGVSLKRVSNILYDLTHYGYLARINIDGEDKRVLTYGEQLDHQQIEEEISRYCSALRGEKVPDIAGIMGEVASAFHAQNVEKAPGKVPGNHEKFPAEREVEESSRKKFPENENSSRLSGNFSNVQGSEKTGTPSYEDIYNNNPPTPQAETPNTEPESKPEPEPKQKRSRGTRLPSDWVLPKSWGEWAIEHFEASADQVRSEAASFRDYWISASGSRAAKDNWLATWRNWIRKKNWRVKKIESEIAPDLVTKKRQTVVFDCVDEHGDPIV